MESQEYYLGIDPSFNGTAITVLSENEIDRKKKYIVFDGVSVIDKVVKKNNKNDYFEKIKVVKKITDVVDDILNRFGENIKIIAIENFSYQSMMNLPIQGIVFGNIMRSIFEYYQKKIDDNNLDIPIIIYPSPKTVKSFVAKGSARKNLMLLNVFKRFKVSFDDDNHADSFVLAHIARCYFLLLKKMQLIEKLKMDNSKPIKILKIDYMRACQSIPFYFTKEFKSVIGIGKLLRIVNKIL